MNYEKVIEYLKNALNNQQIYSGVVPETALVPAIAVTNIAYGASRDLEGVKSRRSSNWRLTLVDSPDTLQTLVDNVLALDNNVYSNHRMFFDLDLIEPINLIEPNQRAFVTLSIY